MKKIIALIMCLTIAFSFASCSCGGKKDNTKPTRADGTVDSVDADFTDISDKTGTTDESGKTKLVVKIISAQCRTYEIFTFKDGKVDKHDEFLQLTDEILYERMKSYIDLTNKKTDAEKEITFDDKSIFTIGASYKSVKKFEGKSFDDVKKYYTAGEDEKVFVVV